MDVFNFILTRLLPKTNQSAFFQSGDDSSYQAGWWEHQRIVANRTRFISVLGGGFELTIDRATKLLWAVQTEANGCGGGNKANFADAISYAEGLTWAGFSDWRLPNVFELMSIKDYSRFNPQLDINFFECHSDWYWTSTTNPKYTENAETVNFASGGEGSSDKAGVQWVRYCRDL